MTCLARYSGFKHIFLKVWAEDTEKKPIHLKNPGEGVTTNISREMSAFQFFCCCCCCFSRITFFYGLQTFGPLVVYNCPVLFTFDIMVIIDCIVSQLC